MMIFFKILIILFINFNFNILNINGYYNPKLYTIQTFDNPRCEGEVKIQRCLYDTQRTTLKHDFLFIWDDGYRRLNCNPEELDDINFPGYPCAWYPIGCNTTDCKLYFKINQCINGEKLVYQKLNYLESKYCVVSESKKHMEIDSRPSVITVYRNKYCYKELFCLQCDLFTFNLTHYDSGKTFFSNNALSIGIMNDTQYGYSSFYQFGDSEFYNSKPLNNSNQLKLNFNLILIISIIIIVFIITTTTTTTTSS